MLIFASSDKGGTGRSVTACNIAYQLSLRGLNVAYLDFDFGSPTAGAIFEVSSAQRGVPDNKGLHSYVRARCTMTTRLDVRAMTDRQSLRTMPQGAGRLVLFPGDEGGAEFPMEMDQVERAARLFRDMEREFDACVVDLSSGRSQSVEMSLRALTSPTVKRKGTVVRWLVFHKWTRQHVVAANGLLFAPRGIVDIAVDAGHDRGEFLRLVRSVRTAVPDLNLLGAADRAVQARWLISCGDELKKLARDNLLGQDRLLASTPLEPMLLWREQIIVESDVHQKIANPGTPVAFAELARKLTDDEAWEGI